METQEIVLKIPDFSDFEFPWWGYLIAWAVLAWGVVGPYFSRYYFKWWMPNEYYKNKPWNSSEVAEYRGNALALWAFAPITSLALTAGWTAWYAGSAVAWAGSKVGNSLIFGRKNV